MYLLSAQTYSNHTFHANAYRISQPMTKKTKKQQQQKQKQNKNKQEDFIFVKKKHEIPLLLINNYIYKMGRAKRIWYLSPMRAAKVQASLRIRAVSPEPPLFAHTSSESRETFRQKARSLAPLNGWACAVKICQDGMLEDTNSLDSAHMIITFTDKSGEPKLMN